MNSVHDLGGMHGFGQVQIEANEPVFHEEWEGRVLGLLSLTGPASGLPQPNPQLRGRAIIESMDPVRYLTASYYERFLEVIARRAVASGLVTEAELRERIERLRAQPDTLLPRRDDPAAVARARAGLQVQAHPEPAGPAPRFGVGDRVLARNLNPAGHTRLPRYIRGKQGFIVRVNGWYGVQDADATALGPSPQPVYTARFDAGEVWGPGAEPNLGIYLELWEGYLEVGR